jgi:hypothetical protein
MSMHENHNLGNPEGLIKLAPTDLQFSNPKKKEGGSDNNKMFSSGYNSFLASKKAWLTENRMSGKTNPSQKNGPKTPEVERSFEDNNWLVRSLIGVKPIGTIEKIFRLTY